MNTKVNASESRVSSCVLHKTKRQCNHNHVPTQRAISDFEETIGDAQEQSKRGGFHQECKIEEKAIKQAHAQSIQSTQHPAAQTFSSKQGLSVSEAKYENVIIYKYYSRNYFSLGGDLESAGMRDEECELRKRLAEL